MNIIYITLAGGLTGLVPTQLRAFGRPGRQIVVEGGRGAAGTVRAVSPGVGTGDTRTLSGRVALADRCRTLGRSFKQDGQLDDAEAAWRQALDLLAALRQVDPDAAELRRRWCDCANDLAWLQANHPDPNRRDPVSAVSMARKVVDDCPDTAVYWNTLGAAHYRAGDDRAAIAALEYARALGGGTAFDDVFLAMAHARLGDLEQARKALARAMIQAERGYPGHPELARLCDEAHSLITGGATAPAIIG